MRVGRTDENAVAGQRHGIVGKPFGHNNNAATAKENAPSAAAAARPLVGKVNGGPRSGARRAALGDISNALQAKVETAW